jgi:hypothetical protein
VLVNKKVPDSRDFLVDAKLLGFGSAEETLLFEGADSLGAELHSDFFAVNHDSLGLKIWLPNLLGVALREADIAAVLLAFAGEFTLLHN